MYVLQKTKFSVLIIISLSLFVLASIAWADNAASAPADAAKTKSADPNTAMQKEVDARVQASIAELKKQMREELRAELKEELKKELGDQLRNEMRIQLSTELRSQLKREIKEELKEEIRGEIIAQLTSAGIETAYIEPNYSSADQQRLSIQKLPQTEAEYETALANVKEKFERAKKAGMQPIADQKFSVSKIEINGNTLIPTSELLANVPASYKVSDQKDGTTVEEEYNLAVVQGIISGPGGARTISQKDIQGFTRYLLSIYQQKGYAGIYVYVPVKTVDGKGQLENNVLNIQILEAKVGKTTASHYDFNHKKRKKAVLKDSALMSWSPVKKGEVIRKKKLDDFVRLLNLNPDRYISPVLSKGDDPNTINLGYDVYEGKPWHFYVQVDNSGTDKRQWAPRVGYVNTNLLGYDDKLNLMYQARPDSMEEMKDNYWVYGSYDFPFMTPRLRLGVYAGYTNYYINPNSGAGINFNGNGSFIGVTARYNMFQKNDWFFDFLGSLSTLTSTTKPSLGIGSKVDIDMLSLGIEAHRTREMSSTTVGFNAERGLGGSSKEDFQKARWQSEPGFSIYSAYGSHKWFLDKAKVHEISISGKGIYPTDRLVPAKMTTFGGMYSVRGYKEDGIVADGGLLASAQYRFDWTRHNEPPDSKNAENNTKMWPPRISLIAFTDYGHAMIKDRVPGEQRGQDLWSIGGGTTLGIGKDLDMGVYFGWPIISTTSTQRGAGKWYFNLIQRW